MNKLCCKLNPEYLCQECGMRVCRTCYAELIPDRRIRDGIVEKQVALIEYHEEGNCPAGADTWLSKGDNDAPMIFGKLPK